MAFLEDPRLRQRWNQISHNAETVTENAAAGIWSFQHNYINPCIASISNSVDQCATSCLGDREERARQQREREVARGNAEYSFDFYDDWYGDEAGGLLGGWSNEDWDRLLAGTGSSRRHGGEIAEQPKRKRGMSYGTRGPRRKRSDSDPTVIPSTQPIGFLGKLPWKIGGTLRYKPSAADLQEHPGIRHGQIDETEPLLGAEDRLESDFFMPAAQPTKSRRRSGTTGSGETSDSFRSRGDLFPSDGEGDEDAVPLDDEFSVALDKVDDRSSNRTRSSKGKRPADGRPMSRTVSRTTIGSDMSRNSRGTRRRSSVPSTPDNVRIPSLRSLRFEEEDTPERRRKQTVAEQRIEIEDVPVRDVEALDTESGYDVDHDRQSSVLDETDAGLYPRELQEEAIEEQGGTAAKANIEFVPARLPRFT